MTMIDDPNAIILNSMLQEAANRWDISENQIMENMNKIAFHESKLDPSAIQKVYPETAEDGSTVWGIGKGKGLFQFESGENQGAHTAITRLITELGFEPEFLKGIADSNYDVSNLTPEQQQMIFLGNLMQMPHKGDAEGRVPANFAGVDTNEELANYWAQYHQAGTELGTPEYESMLDKFTEDVEYYNNKK